MDNPILGIQQKEEMGTNFARAMDSSKTFLTLQWTSSFLLWMTWMHPCESSSTSTTTSSQDRHEANEAESIRWANSFSFVELLMPKW